jgi:tetratricopeptide (TPR) repeat protein
MIAQQSGLNVSVGADRRDQRWRVAGLCLALAAITFAVFGQTLAHGFLNFDDSGYVYENPVVVRGLTFNGVVWAFTQAQSANWFPLTWLSHMLDCQLYGLRPAGHHLTNVLLHTATVILLFLFLRAMTGALWRSAFVAAVFAIHPLRVESVAWVAERKDVLSGLFFMLTIGAYVRYARRPWSPTRYGLVVFLFAMGLMCKPMLVTLPIVLLLLDYWPLQRVESAGRLVLEKLPLLGLSAAVSLATLLAQHGSIQSTGSFSLPARLANALAGCMIYLRQMIYPAGLAPFYPYPLNGLPAWEVMLAGALLAGLSAIALGRRRKQPWLFIGWLWYLVMLLPVIGVIQVGDQSHADRYTYLPQIGIYVALAWMAAEWGANRRLGRVAMGGLMAGMVGVLTVVAWKQAAYWKTDEALWTRALACTSDNYVAHFTLGNVLRQQGRMAEAAAHYQNAVQIRPGYPQAQINLGEALLLKGEVDHAITHFQIALQINPGFAEAHFNLAVALSQKGRWDDAIAQYQMALQINPDNAVAHCNLGAIFGQQGRTDEAIRQFQKALEIQPEYADARDGLGNCFSQMGRMDDAIAHYQKAVEIRPDFAEARKNLAWILATCPQAALRNGKKAVELAQRANQLTGGENPLYLCALAAACAEAGRFPEAVETARRALRLAEAQSNSRLAGQLQFELNLYQSGSPFHVPEQTH